MSAKWLIPVTVIAILGGMILPGYILTLDMVWAPQMPLEWSREAPNNTFLIDAFVHVLSLMVPAWLVQKGMLIALFALMLAVPWRCLPLDPFGRAFGAAVYTLNPFVYARLLAGQWMVLFGYALLPLVLYLLLRLTRAPDARAGVALGGGISLIALTSLHYAYLMTLFSVVWIVGALFARSRERMLALARAGISAIATILAANAYWLVPALMRDAPLEGRFTSDFYRAFSAAGNDAIPVMLNTLTLGGFWGEGLAWRYYFVWPQESSVFWMAAVALGILAAFGMREAWRRGILARREIGMLAGAAVFAYIFGLGLAATPFAGINGALYEHMPLWSGLRDSHKILGVLAVAYALFAGAGASALARVLAERAPRYSGAAIGLFLIPATFGMYLWSGFHGQLQPVAYPPSWHTVRALVMSLESGERALVLPWHGYLSLDFAHDLVLANPAPLFFGAGSVSGRGIEFGGVRDQETNEAYRTIDALMQRADELPGDVLYEELRALGISALIIIPHSAIPHSAEGLTEWRQFTRVEGEDVQEALTWRAKLAAYTRVRVETFDIVYVELEKSE